MRQHQVVQLQPEQLALGRALARHQVERIGTQLRSDDVILEARDLPDRAVQAQQVVRVLATIAIGHRRDHGAAARPGLQRDLRHLGEILAHHVTVLGGVLADAVVIDLLIEMLALGRLAGLGVARVPEARAVIAPGHAAAAGGVLHARDDRIHRLAAGHVDDVQRTVLAAVLRHRDGHQLARGRGHEPVDGRRALGVQRVRVQHDARTGRVGVRPEQRDHRLLLGRLVVQREQLAACGLQVVIGAGAGGGLLHQPIEHAAARGQLVEVGARALVLRGAPLLHLRIVGLFQPAVGIADGDAAAVAVGDGHGGGRRRAAVSRMRQQRARAQQERAGQARRSGHVGSIHGFPLR